MSIFTKILSLFLVFSVFLTGCTLGPVFGGDIPIGPKGIIYSEDDRLDYYEIYELNIQEQARACPALMRVTRLHENEDGSFDIRPYRQADGTWWTYGERYDFEEYVLRFQDQPMAASCSAFLVAPNIVVTAGHCVHDKTEDELEAIRFVFGYWMNSSLDANLSVPAENVYSVKRIIHSEHNSLMNIDYAVIELDRDCTVAEPLFIASEPLKEGDYVYTIGYPNGLPLKYAPNAYVIRLDPNSFLASLDAFKGNSGSPVFNANGEIVGVYMETFLTIIGVDLYGRHKPHGPVPIDTGGNRSTYADFFRVYIQDTPSVLENP